jgi:hypothetical protein
VARLGGGPAGVFLRAFLGRFLRRFSGDRAAAF